MNAELAASMIAPTVLAIALGALGLIAGDAILAVQHVVMIPAMVGVMLWRYDHCAHRGTLPWGATNEFCSERCRDAFLQNPRLYAVETAPRVARRRRRWWRLS